MHRRTNKERYTRGYIGIEFYWTEPILFITYLFILGMNNPFSPWGELGGLLSFLYKLLIIFIYMSFTPNKN